MRAEQILQDAFQVLKSRGQQYGDGERERTMDKIVALYTQVTGIPMSTANGWLFMICLKLARIVNESSSQLDSFVDAINYLALLGEEVLPQEESKS